MMDNDTVIQQIRANRADQVWKPRHEWVTAERHRLLVQIQGQREGLNQTQSWMSRVHSTVQVFVSPRLLRLIQHAAVILLTGSVAVGGGIVSARAFQDSLAGEALYNVKLAIEKTEVTVAAVVGSVEAVASKELDFAARRAREVKNSPSA